MKVSKILRCCIFCCISAIIVNINKCSAIDINNTLPNQNIIINNDIIHTTDIDDVYEKINKCAYPYIFDLKLDCDLVFKCPVTIYSNDIFYDFAIINNNNFVNIYKNDPTAFNETDDKKLQFINNVFIPKLNSLQENLEQDFITNVKAYASKIFGSDYKVYFKYRNMNYNGTTIYDQYFSGTFEQLMKNYSKELINKVEIDLQFMQNIWHSCIDPKNFANTKHLIVTNNKTTYYFDIPKNMLNIYSSIPSPTDWVVSANKVHEFLNKIKEIWTTEQNVVKQSFGADYKIYYGLEFYDDK